MKSKCLHTACYFNILVTFFYVFILNIKTHGQDPEFSQYFNNPLFHNPASAGESEYSRLNIDYRNRWPFHSDLRNTFISYCASYDQPLLFTGGGIGIIVSRDAQANSTFTNSFIGIMYSHHIQVSKEFLILSALQFSIVQSHFDATNIILPDRIFNSNSTMEQISSESNIYLDYSIGFKGIYQLLEFNIALHHLTKPQMLNESYTLVQYRKYAISTQYTFLLENIRQGITPRAIIPYIIYQYQGSFQQMQYGCIYQTNPISGGLFLKQNMAFKPYSSIIYLGIKYKSFTFGYSYDYNLPNRNVYVPFSGGHEVTLQLNLYKFEKSKGIKAIKCPKI